MACKEKWVAVLLSFGLVIVFAGKVLADKLVLENGDTLTGTVEKVVGDKLTLKTNYSSPIEIQLGKIKKIFTDQPVEVHLKSGEILKGKIQTLEDGQLVVEKSEERATASIDRDKVAAVNPPKPKKWSASLTAGGSLQSGNTDRAAISVAAEAVRKTESDRFSVRYLFNYAEEDGEMTTRNHFGEMKYDYFFTKHLYGYLAGDLYNDVFKDLKLQTNVGPGIGYMFWDDPVKALSLEAGLSYTNKDFYEGRDEDFLSARLGGEFRYKIFDFLTFSERALFYPSLGQGGQYRLRNEASLAAPLGSRWALKLSNIIEYDSDPSPGTKKSDVTWILGLQFSF